jgi:archaellum component FlaC
MIHHCHGISMNLKLPQDIYIRVSEQINAIVNSLECLSLGEEIAAARRTALEIFTKISDEITNHITTLEQSSEWDTYTIAFYGETNAGKSTLIETLRILLNEPLKVQERAEFIALRDKYDITDERLEALHAQIAQSDQMLADLQSKLNSLNSTLDEQVALLRKQLSELQRLIHEKTQSSLWKKIMHILGRLPEQREQSAVEEAIQCVDGERAAASAEFQRQQAQAEREKADQERLLHDSEAAIAHLATLGDGAIIGNGRPDFTVNTQKYHFNADAEPFVLLDVPGIEGSEEKVKDEIWAAVRKAHAVFYVTGKAVAPQQGSEEHPGTLQKIKQHLGAQTEVWTIFNKRISSPTPLKQAELINDGERDSLHDLNEKMRGELGEHYRRTVSVSALPAFLAVADCLPPASHHANGRAKFLANFNREQILERTNLSGLRQLLLDDLVKDNKKKIYRSNFNKANQVVLAAISDVNTTLKQIFRPLGTQLKRDATMASKQLDTAFDALKTRLESKGESAISSFVSAVRRSVYKAIDDDISNDEFKRVFSRTIAAEQEKLTDRLPEVMHEEVKKFQNQTADIIERFKELAEELMSAYDNIQVNGIGAKIDLDIKIDNGINIPGLIGALAGGLLMIWNPAGWVMLALGAVTVLVGMVKAVIGFFSSDYKKSQQRKSVDANLSDISDKMRRALRDSLEEALPQLEPKVGELKAALRGAGEQVAKVVEHLAKVEKQLKNISKNIETTGAL